MAKVQGGAHCDHKISFGEYCAKCASPSVAAQRRSDQMLRHQLAAEIEQHIATERERCARICDEAAEKQSRADSYAAALVMTVADLIRNPVE